MRQIDADNLWEVLRGEEGAKALKHSPVKLMAVKQIIDNAPTTDAIPVEWLKQWRDKLKGMGEYQRERAEDISFVLRLWQKEG